MMTRPRAYLRPNINFLFLLILYYYPVNRFQGEVNPFEKKTTTKK